MSDDQLAGLEPAILWRHFSELTRIARPSKEEERARNHVLGWAAARDLGAQVDAEGNVVIRVPASYGRDRTPVVVLQSHLDMVCEREPASSFDPREGRIDVRVEDDWVVAEGTTLGADNGIGVAAAMAVADDAAIEHGPLELLFTVSEEQGLDGAKALDASLVSGRLLVNLDGTSDEALTVGCAGSDHAFLRLRLPGAPVSMEQVALCVELSGAKGGHSGADIAAGRTNAIKALGRVLTAGFDATHFGLGSLDGGVSRNAIPRDATAVVSVDADSASVFEDAARAELSAIAHRHADTDGDLRLTVTPTAAHAVADHGATRRALDLIAAIPTGVIAMTPGLPGVVETSTSLTVAQTEVEELTLASMARSSNAGALDELKSSMESLARLAGAEIEVRRSYPPWEPRLDSALLRTARATFARLFGTEPGVTVVHGGLECAVLGQKIPDVEMISIGPEIVGPHAPGERVRISSTQRFYRLLGALLDDLSR